MEPQPEPPEALQQSDDENSDLSYSFEVMLASSSSSATRNNERERPETPDTPISNYRRKTNNDLPLPNEEDSIDVQLQAELLAAKRAASFSSSHASEDERIQALVQKALSNQRIQFAIQQPSTYRPPVSALSVSPKNETVPLTTTTTTTAAAGVDSRKPMESLLDEDDAPDDSSLSPSSGPTVKSEEEDEIQQVRSTSSASFDNAAEDDIQRARSPVESLAAESLQNINTIANAVSRINIVNDDEKKEEEIETIKSPTTSGEGARDELLQRARSPDADRRAHFANNIVSNSNNYLRIDKSLSMTESDVGSLDGLPVNVKSRWMAQGELRREKILQSLDGVDHRLRKKSTEESETLQIRQSRSDTSKAKSPEKKRSGPSLLDSLGLGFLLPSMSDAPEQVDEPTQKRTGWSRDDDMFALLGCANIIHREERVPEVHPSLVRVASYPPPQSFLESIHSTEVDTRMQSWIKNQFITRDKPSKDGTYLLGRSRTVLVHEIVRGSWTWCTAWSPNGTMLAVATENHHLAVVDTTSSAVWRVRHDRRLTGPVRNGTTHSIRAIAWGSRFIAIGGTGNAVSILAPIEPYPVLHAIMDTGFVGSLHWKPNSSDLVIGSRLDKAIIVRVRAMGEVLNLGSIETEELCTIERKSWVHAVAFSRCGRYLAIGDAAGCLLVYNYFDERGRQVEVSLIKTFSLEDAVLTIEWSPDGKWLYAGGEDFRVTVVDVGYWEIVHRLKQDRWVQCIASSNSGSHVAVGGVSSEISVLDVENGWDSVMGIELNGLVPLSAKWHPKDQYLALTGQSNSILVVETTNARHVKGHHLHSISPILAIEFSPDGRMAVVGNESGLVTVYSLSASSFVTNYELVVTLNDRLSIQWSSNGIYVVIGTKDALIVVGRKQRQGQLPPNTFGFSVRRMFRDLADINDVSVDFQSQYIAVSGNGTWVLDATQDFAIVREWTSGPSFANAWAADGRWLATFGQDKILTIYDTSDEQAECWRSVFSVTCDEVGRALAWGPVIASGLLYLAYGGDGREINIMEIRTQEGTWETVLRIQKPAAINALDWNRDGLLAAAIGNGTVSIIDLSYLQLGVPVNEMDYNWQRQALTCFTEIRRNRGKNSMRCVRWIPSAPGSDSLLAAGGTDGELEIIDLTERDRCQGYAYSRS